MAKYLASEYCKEVVEDSFRIHGGYGYSKEYEIERLYREAPMLLIGEGTVGHPEDDHRSPAAGGVQAAWLTPGPSDTADWLRHGPASRPDCAAASLRLAACTRRCCRSVADDVEAGGPARDVLRRSRGRPGAERARPAADGRGAPAGARAGGRQRWPCTTRRSAATATAVAAWPALRDVLVEHGDELRAVAATSRRRPTRWAGRRADRWAAARRRPGGDRPLRLVEIGASAGLNLRADRFRVELGRRPLGVGPPDSPVVLRDPWPGAAPPLGPAPLASSSGSAATSARSTPRRPRAGCGSRPTCGPTSRSGSIGSARRPELAPVVPATRRAAGAGDFVRPLELAPGTTTVLWHSIMWQYLDPAEQGRSTSAGAGSVPPPTRTGAWSAISVRARAAPPVGARARCWCGCGPGRAVPSGRSAPP